VDTFKSNSILIGGNWVPVASGKTLPVLDPSHGTVLSHIAAGERIDVNRAVNAAPTASDDTWGRTPATERGRILQRWARLIEDHKNALALLESRDTGKPISVARNDIDVTARYFEYYGGAADKLHGQVIPFLDG